MEIAVLIGPDGETVSIHTPGEIHIYQYTCNTWELCRSMPFAIQSTRGLSAMREYMQTVIEFLGECRTFVGCSVAGLPFFELEKAGFTTWEMPGYPGDFLDSIRKSESVWCEMSGTPDQSAASLPELHEISPRCYSISLKEIQNCSGAITSKQVLLPLLAKNSFSILEVICSHVPPWLEVKILSGEIDATTDKRSPHEARIKIKAHDA